MNILILIMVLGIAAALYLITKKKITRGSSCCGEHEAMVKKVKCKDMDPKHYPYHYLLKVEGMVCANCARRVENVFHETGQMMAKADLGKKEVRLFSKQVLDRRESAKLVEAAGYTLREFEKV